MCPSTCYLVCPLWYWYTVDSVLCALVGFLHGLCDARLPDTYTWLGCGIRPHVLSTQKVLDPFSPFLLALPPTLPPMWSTSSPEGGRDVVHGNLIPAGQRTGLLQCSRCEQPLHTHASCAVVELCWLQEDSVVHVLCANGCQSVVLCVILTHRCQGWSSSGVSQLKYGAHSTSSLDHLWLQHCPCGSSWVLREPSLWRDAH